MNARERLAGMRKKKNKALLWDCSFKLVPTGLPWSKKLNQLN
jgi:hypothetical protein